MLILGTAQWGWTTLNTTAFAMLDEWYARGFREVDAATNYPIDKVPEHFRLSEKILLEWINAHGISDLEIMVKVGSVNNLRSPEHILTKSFLLMMLDEYQYMFKSNLATLMVHWDNRDNKDEIGDTFEAFHIAHKKGIKLGLSGIRYPELYAELNAGYNFNFRIQMKHNLIYSDYKRYAPFHEKKRFIAYGINAGGVKLNKKEYAENSTLKARGGNLESEPPFMPQLREIISEWNKSQDFNITHFNQIGMVYAFYQKDMSGILLGTSKVEQLKASIGFFEEMKRRDFSILFKKLMAISHVM